MNKHLRKYCGPLLALLLTFPLPVAPQSPPINEIILGASRITVQITPGHLALPRSAVMQWIRRCAEAVSRYYGHFPTNRATIRVMPTSGSGFGFATTDSEGDRGVIVIPLGENTTQRQLDNDWVLTHEMVHLAFPLVYPRDRWLVEGMATYIEPLARMKAGYIGRERIWQDLVKGLPQGLPAAGDRGLNNNQDWGRIYWGGALYCLMADLEIRRMTANKKGLQDALQEIDSTDSDITSDVEVIDAIRIGDGAICSDCHFLEKLYEKMKDNPVKPDLDKLWKDLGVKSTNGKVTFDESAPLAATRRAIERMPAANAD
ncbi:MAG: hypothetical protein JST01_12880 [Cyanobacteria bacterium SZAS TMP-1]|nr:hypothetical protein [Cyanobacteria bacterium SZAS TMP-1]